MHELFCNCALVQDIFSYPYQNCLTLPSEIKWLVSWAAAGTCMRGVKGGSCQGFHEQQLCVSQVTKQNNSVIVDL